ncbi:MAG: hypothetical protein J6S40_01345, partial [Thermoguttaceae bacterium]|nr:hypothetical protein [Thermoguttaceae bacterium]
MPAPAAYRRQTHLKKRYRRSRSARKGRREILSRDDSNAVSPSRAFFPESELPSLRRRTRAWFARCGRDLPWRRTRDPYAVWVSEIMLQQTTTETVIGYYGRFLDRFPTVEALARADISEVLRFWEGLGYYRRAHLMHAAAGVILNKYGGRFPARRGEIETLPGFGRYTAGAVLSFALGRREPIL